MQPAELQAALARVLHDPAFTIAYAGPDAVSSTSTARRSSFPGRRPAARWRGWRATGRRSPRSSTTVRSTTTPSWSTPSAGAATIALENRLLQAQSDARLAELQASRQRAVTAADAERRRIERNLHDGAQQRLVTLALQLSLIQRRIRDDPGDAEQLVATASDELAASLAELRELARGIHPAALEQGLEPALEALVLRSAGADGAVVQTRPRRPGPVEFAAYFVASEALANVAKYAGATSAMVRRLAEHGQHRRRDRRRRRRRRRPAAARACAAWRTGWRPSAAACGLSSPPGGGTVVTAELPGS